MSNGLTHDDVKALARPFAFADHEFLRGYCYIAEEAVTRRLDEIDPAWDFQIHSIAHRDKQLVVTASLTVKGVTRAGVGMQVIEYMKEKPGVEVGEAEKGAATDALKRCARLFGIGRYILSAPKEGGAFKSWLAEQQRNLGAVSPAQVQQAKATLGNGDTPRRVVQPEPVQEAAYADMPRSWDVETLWNAVSGDDLFNARRHFDNALVHYTDPFDDDYCLRDEMTQEQAEAALRNKRLERLAQKAWDKAAAQAFVTHWQGEELDTDDLLMALGVSRLGEWKDSAHLAHDMVAAWIKGNRTEAQQFAALGTAQPA